MQPNTEQANVSPDIGTIQRDKYGRLLPGQKLYKLRKHEGGGRKPSVDSWFRTAIQRKEKAILEKVIKLATDGKDERVCLQAGELCLAYLHGRPHISIDQRIKAMIVLTADDLELATRQPLLEEHKLIEQYATQGEEADNNST